MNIQALLSDVDEVLILGHHNADPDAVCSMAAFYHLYKAINPKGNAVLACDDISKLASKVLAELSPDVQFHEELNKNFEFIVLLDTNSPLQLGPKFEHYATSTAQVLVIDHHEENPGISSFAKYTLVKSDRFSACEILVQLHQELNIPITEASANLLLTGILFDSRRFFYADSLTMEIALHLLKMGANYSRCLQSLVTQPDRSERIARLKAAGRVKIELIDDWIIVTSKIGAYEASACRGLIDLGADVAIVGGKPSKDVVRISSRSTQEFYLKTGVNLGTDIMEPIGEIISGKGGGHPNAAGANGVQNREKALSEAVELIRRTIDRKKRLSESD
ncbi:MAG: bifunctional oligoribonuclease/PAP phosphatase NrnA [Candidatus Thorarchaeota archaeon]